MNPGGVAKEITAALRKHRTGSRQGHRPSAESDFGVYAADLRKVVGTYRKQFKAERGEALYDLALALLDQRITECRQVAYELLGGHAEARSLMNATRLEQLGKGLDNWASVDVFCCELVGQAWREGQISDARVYRWARSRDLWWRRVAVVATIPLNMRSRGGTGDSPRTREVCGLLMDDGEAMVQKAISWALRELIHWDRAGVKQFLEEKPERVPALVRREVMRKLTTGKKNR